MLWILPAIFVLVHTPSGDTVRSYEGQSQEMINTLLANEGNTGDFITRQQYDAFITAHAPVPPTPAELIASLRAQAIQEFNSAVDASVKRDRAMVWILIDELNILRQRDRDRSADVAAATTLADLKSRWALRSTLTDRTTDQAKTAFQNKINGGGAD